jgi:hypothetical protein
MEIISPINILSTQVIRWRLRDSDGADFGTFSSHSEACLYADALDSQAEYVSIIREVIDTEGR